MGTRVHIYLVHALMRFRVSLVDQQTEAERTGRLDAAALRESAEALDGLDDWADKQKELRSLRKKAKDLHAIAKRADREKGRHLYAALLSELDQLLRDLRADDHFTRLYGMSDHERQAIPQQAWKAVGWIDGRFA
jgi:hypothetical protein